MMVLVHVALETVQDVIDLGKAMFFQVTPGVDRTPPGAADQHHRAVDRRRPARVAKEIRIDVPVGAVLPGDVDGTDRMTDEQVFDFRAAVDEHRFGMRLQESMRFLGREMLHGALHTKFFPL